MKRRVLLILVAIIIIFLSGCSNEFELYTGSEYSFISLSYNGNKYYCISAEDCEYQYNAGDMVYLFSTNYKELFSTGEEDSLLYNVYRHTDDKSVKYLFVTPKPSVRDAIPYAFVLKVKD